MKEAALKSPIAAGLAFFSYLLGVLNELVVVLMFFMALDMLTGVMRAFLTKSLNSSFGLKGIFKKITMIIVIGVSAGVEFAVQQAGFSTQEALTILVTCFFIVNESISILENASQMGVPVPSILQDALEKLQEATGKERKVTRKKKTTTNK